MVFEAALRDEAGNIQELSFVPRYVRADRERGQARVEVRRRKRQIIFGTEDSKIGLYMCSSS